MILSASRRTDIPAFYTSWLINRVRAGYCTVPNPFNRQQVSYVSLKPEDVDVIVFWTRNPAPLLPYLPELDALDLRYYFQYTILDNPRQLDPSAPPLSAALEIFKKLAGLVGPAKVIWRYDPIVFTPQTGIRFHIETYQKIAAALQGTTQRSVISVMDVYKKIGARLRRLEAADLPVIPYAGRPDPNFAHLMCSLAETAALHGLEIYSCAEDLDLAPYGIRPGKCVDDAYIQKVFGLDVTHKKDPSQRAACGCVASKDIGAYDTCLFGCQYCYATASFERARTNHAAHDAQSPSIIGWYEAPPPTARPLAARPLVGDQLSLFGESDVETA